MVTSQIVAQILNGISFGLVLFLLAAGLSLIFGFMGIVNMAHGSFYMLGAYVGSAVMLKSGSFVLAVVTGAVSVAILGFGIERLFLRHFYKRESDQVLLTFGFVFVIEGVTKWIWGGNPQGIPKPEIFANSINIMGTMYPSYRLFLIFVGTLVAVLLWVTIEKTRVGTIVRAGVDDNEMVSGMGINVNVVFSFIVVLATLLAGFGGVIGGPIIGAYPGLDLHILLLSLIVVVVGGLGTLKGALYGSLLIGFIDSFGKVFFPSFAAFSMYATMVVILLIRPQGLVGKEEH